MKAPLAVTTTAKQPGRYARVAREVAEAWQLPFLERGEKTPLARLLETDAEALFVLGGDGWTLHDTHGAAQFSPGLARVRIARLRDGVQQPDQLIQVSGLTSGESVVDCTLGLGVDAQVCAHVVGASGRVVGVEAARPLAMLVQLGRPPGVEVIHARAADFLRAQPDASFDVVFFDPMFSHPARASAAFGVLRRYAVHAPLDEPTLREARRVARRCVVIKTGHHDTALAPLGLRSTPLTRFSTFAWARVPPASGDVGGA